MHHIINIQSTGGREFRWMNYWHVRALVLMCFVCERMGTIRYRITFLYIALGSPI